MTPEDAARVRAAAVRRILWGVQNGDGVEIRSGGAVPYQEAVKLVVATLGPSAARLVVQVPT